MSLTMAAFTLLNVWCLSLFMVVPFFVRVEQQRGTHDYAAAPKKPNWKKILLVNTAVAVVITGAIALLLKSGMIELREYY